MNLEGMVEVCCNISFLSFWWLTVNFNLLLPTLLLSCINFKFNLQRPTANLVFDVNRKLQYNMGVPVFLVVFLHKFVSVEWGGDSSVFIPCFNFKAFPKIVGFWQGLESLIHLVQVF